MIKIVRKYKNNKRERVVFLRYFYYNIKRKNTKHLMLCVIRNTKINQLNFNK